MTECAICSKAVALCFYGNTPPLLTGLMAFKALPVDISGSLELSSLINSTMTSSQLS